MYAVIETGGKQYRVEVGTELEVELLDGGAGDSIAFDRILLIADGDAASIGRPVVANASVSGEILRRDRGEKLISFKYRPKARRRVKKGHRQELTVVRISDIVLDGKSAAKEYAAAEQQKQTERQRLQEAAKKQAEQDAALAAKLAADAKPAKSEKAPAKGEAKSDAKATKPAARTATKPAAKPAAKASTKTTTSKAAKADTTDKGAAKKAAPRSKKSE
ncbi:MAG TPA: 50S ribosomal protein L21 [Candidatus Limnocylindrales bacterium]|jgi:large subunit ribosomal protein L21|nr:50S ribosomal protein L21 [Candidatus Limnocylindrales bacterium]